LKFSGLFSKISTSFSECLNLTHASDIFNQKASKSHSFAHLIFKFHQVIAAAIAKVQTSK